MDTFFLNTGSWFLLVCLCFQLQGQSPYILRGDQAYHTYDRAEILKLSDTSMINGLQNYSRRSLIGFLDQISDSGQYSEKDRYDFQHIYADNMEFLQEKKHLPDPLLPHVFRSADENREGNESRGDNSAVMYTRKPLLKYFYASRANLFEIKSKHITLFVNPVIQLNYLQQKQPNRGIFQNTWGADIRGYLGKRVYVYAQLSKNQRNYPAYTEERILKFGALPGQGSWKNYTLGIVKGLDGYDFLNARAYIGFNPVKSISIEFGYGNHFIGNGYRSLLLSDYSRNYTYLKFNTRIWKFQYQNIFAQLSPTTPFFNADNSLLPKKYTALHYLAFKPNSSFEIGLFETVIFARPDHFEFQYLNPVILYRAVEHFLDSPDNVILGLNTKWNPGKGISLYGQIIVDEFKLSEVKKQSGWWANKFGVQAGFKYINAFGIDHLDLQFEYNAVRPYTYAHRDTLPTLKGYSVANYSHSNQPLAHPLGANFREMIWVMRYKPINKIYIQSRVLYTTYGDDRPGENWGGNILLPLETIQQAYGNYIGQGLKKSVLAVYADVSYEIYHNYFLDLQCMWRQTKTDGVENQHYFGGGLRVNISNISYEY